MIDTPLPRCIATGKVCFPKRLVQEKTNKLMGRTRKGNRRSKDMLSYYHCPDCNWWHLRSEKFKK